MTTEPAATTEFSPIVTPPTIVALAATQTFLINDDGLSDCGGVAPRRFKGMAGRDDAYVWPDHHIVRDVEAAKVIKSAVLIYEDITSDADFVPAGSIEWRDQYKALVYLFTGEFAEQGPNFFCIIERQAVKRGGDRHRSFDICQHGR